MYTHIYIHIKEEISSDCPQVKGRCLAPAFTVPSRPSNGSNASSTSQPEDSGKSQPERAPAEGGVRMVPTAAPGVTPFLGFISHKVLIKHFVLKSIH